jgi:hypothetical protein
MPLHDHAQRLDHFALGPSRLRASQARPHRKRHSEALAASARPVGQAKRSALGRGAAHPSAQPRTDPVSYRTTFFAGAITVLSAGVSTLSPIFFICVSNCLALASMAAALIGVAFPAARTRALACFVMSASFLALEEPDRQACSCRSRCSFVCDSQPSRTPRTHRRRRHLDCSLAQPANNLDLDWRNGVFPSIGPNEPGSALTIRAGIY